MSTQYLKALIAVVLLATLAGCATGGASYTSDYPASASGEAVG
jgi:predicted small lipoprotein YifL